MTMFNKDQIFQLLESRDGEALRALWQGRGAVDIAALLDSVEDSARAGGGVPHAAQGPGGRCVLLSPRSHSGHPGPLFRGRGAAADF